MSHCGFDSKSDELYDIHSRVRGPQDVISRELPNLLAPDFHSGYPT